MTTSTTPTVSVVTPGPARHALGGVLLVLAAAMLWGTTGTAQSFVTGALSPYWIGALRVAVATLFFAAYIAVTIGAARAMGMLAAMDWPLAALAGASMAGYNLFFFAGVKATGVAVGTALVLGSSPLWAGALQMALGARPGRGWWLGTALAITGGVLLVLERSSGARGDPLGIMLCLAAGFSYAAYTVLNKRLVRDYDAAIVTLAAFSIGAAIALPLAWWLAGALPISARGASVVLFLGILATGVAYLLYSNGLRSVSAAGAVSLGLMESVTAFVLALLVVGERPGALAYAGVAILLVGLAIVIRTEARAAAAARPGP